MKSCSYQYFVSIFAECRISSVTYLSTCYLLLLRCLTFIFTSIFIKVAYCLCMNILRPLKFCLVRGIRLLYGRWGICLFLVLALLRIGFGSQCIGSLYRHYVRMGWRWLADGLVEPLIPNIFHRHLIRSHPRLILTSFSCHSCCCLRDLLFFRLSWLRSFTCLIIFSFCFLFIALRNLSSTFSTFSCVYRGPIQPFYYILKMISFFVFFVLNY